MRFGRLSRSFPRGVLISYGKIGRVEANSNETVNTEGGGAHESEPLFIIGLMTPRYFTIVIASCTLYVPAVTEKTYLPFPMPARFHRNAVLLLPAAATAAFRTHFP